MKVDDKQELDIREFSIWDIFMHLTGDTLSLSHEL
jgi:hypothetical protein